MNTDLSLLNDQPDFVATFTKLHMGRVFEDTSL